MSIKRDTVEERKALPLAKGVLDYFPDALLAVAEVSRVGNEQHHPGQPLHWDKSKSTDEADALMRHLLDRGTRDSDGLRHSAKVAWRALALLQRELDAEAEATVEPVYAGGPTWNILPAKGNTLEATMLRLGMSLADIDRVYQSLVDTVPVVESGQRAAPQPRSLAKPMVAPCAWIETGEHAITCPEYGYPDHDHYCPRSSDDD